MPCQSAFVTLKMLQEAEEAAGDTDQLISRWKAKTIEQIAAEMKEKSDEKTATAESEVEPQPGQFFIAASPLQIDFRCVSADF